MTQRLQQLHCLIITLTNNIINSTLLIAIYDINTEYEYVIM